MNEKISKNLIPIVIIAVGLIIAGSFFYFNQCSSEDIGQEKAKEKAISYINENLLAPGIVASVVDILETGSVYKISLEIKENDNVLAEIDSYIGKDGKFFFPEGYNMDESLNQGPDNQEPVQEPVQEQEPLSLEQETKMTDFVQCLAQSNVVIYASRTCPACTDLMAKFGGYDIVAPIVIECGENPDLCDQKNITAVPTIFINDQEYSGNRSLESFAQETGCNL